MNTRGRWTWDVSRAEMYVASFQGTFADTNFSFPLSSLTFGLGGTDEHGNTKEGFGYYETIAGGSGAGPSWHGTSGEFVAQRPAAI